MCGVFAHAHFTPYLILSGKNFKFITKPCVINNLYPRWHEEIKLSIQEDNNTFC